MKNEIRVVGAALVDEQKNIYLLRKKKTGLFEFPGGKIEALEFPKDALIRELQEELKLEIPQVGISLGVAHGETSKHRIHLEVFEVELNSEQLKSLFQSVNLKVLPDHDEVLTIDNRHLVLKTWEQEKSKITVIDQDLLKEYLKKD